MFPEELAVILSPRPRATRSSYARRCSIWPKRASSVSRMALGARGRDDRPRSPAGVRDVIGRRLSRLSGHDEQAARRGSTVRGRVPAHGRRRRRRDRRGRSARRDRCRARSPHRARDRHLRRVRVHARIFPPHARRGAEPEPPGANAPVDRDRARKAGTRLAPPRHRPPRSPVTTSAAPRFRCRAGVRTR